MIKLVKMKYYKKQEDNKYEVDKYKRDSVFAELKQFDLGFAKEHDYIEVTEWKNGEGVDVDINTIQSQRFQLTWGQYEALKYLVSKLENGYEER